MRSQTALITAEELIRMPESGGRDELIAGIVQHRSYAYTREGQAASILLYKVGRYVLAHDLGHCVAPCGFVLAMDPDTVRAPSGAFIARAREDTPLHPSGYWQGVPDLAILVMSALDVYGELAERVQNWRQAGTPMLIVADPYLLQVTVYQPDHAPLLLTEADRLDGGDVVPGWRLPVREIFA
ncbi:MAG: Uma2 family endonuclease [Chloroflexota bacterium]|nr:Uma2 family endonuclease [Chloroflexota bacterium]